MKKKITKQMVMKHYYSDEELKDMGKMSVERTLRWLEEGRRFFSGVLSKRAKQMQDKLAAEGW